MKPIAPDLYGEPQADLFERESGLAAQGSPDSQKIQTMTWWLPRFSATTCKLNFVPITLPKIEGITRGLET